MFYFTYFVWDQTIDPEDKGRTSLESLRDFILTPKLDLDRIHWVVVGGETNKRMKFRPMEEKWVIDIRDQVKNAGLPFMFKHWPGKTHNAKEALLECRIWAEYSESVIRNMDWSAQLD